MPNHRLAAETVNGRAKTLIKVKPGQQLRTTRSALHLTIFAAQAPHQAGSPHRRPRPLQDVRRDRQLQHADPERHRLLRHLGERGEPAQLPFPPHAHRGDDNRRACSLYLSLMDLLGVRLPLFGDSDRRLEGLAV